jgi:hypothetical protein
VEVSELAESQYNAFLHYLYYDLKNEQAVKNLMNDFNDTISILEQGAGSFAYCQNERLRGKGLYKLNFQRHRYLFVYRIVDNTKVIVEGMYHELQNYENTI